MRFINYLEIKSTLLSNSHYRSIIATVTTSSLNVKLLCFTFGLVYEYEFQKY